MEVMDELLTGGPFGERWNGGTRPLGYSHDGVSQSLSLVMGMLAVCHPCHPERTDHKSFLIGGGG